MAELNDKPSVAAPRGTARSRMKAGVRSDRGVQRFGDRSRRSRNGVGGTLPETAAFKPFRAGGQSAATTTTAGPRRARAPKGQLSEAASGPVAISGGAASTAAAMPIEMFYDGIAEEFDRIMNRYDVERRIDAIFDVLLGGIDLAGRSLLDAGCGTGLFSARACQRGAKVTALDIGPRLLEQVRRKCGARTVRGDVLDLKFRDGAFDVVVSSECIEHTRDPRKAVHEMIRVCRPGGLIAITCPNHFWYWLCAVANRLHLRPYEGLESWPRWSELKGWVEETGARILEMRGIHLFPFQIAALQPALKFLDRFGRSLGRFCVNQAVLAIKPC